jgi:DMSO/TMAO reductase YedYZ molybdopterin-dependent catalytic subunit
VGTEERRLDDLPVFEDAVVPDVDPESWRLTVGGEVERPLSLSLAILLEMPESELCAPFRCTSGWVVPDNTWRGVAMSDLLAMAVPSASARYAVAAAAGYSVLVPRGSLQGGLVALWRNGRPLEPVHGFPARLVLPQSDCARSVKWLDSIVLTAEPVPTTGEETASARGAAGSRGTAATHEA